MHNQQQTPTVEQLEAEIHIWRNCMTNAKKEAFRNRFRFLMLQKEKELLTLKEHASPTQQR